MSKVNATTFKEYNEQYNMLLKELERESDRGCILICTSLLDGLLEEALKKYFFLRKKKNSVINELFKGPLHSFAAKTKFAYLFSIIEEWMLDDLNIMRKLRNDCAHQFSSVSFKDGHITRKTENLQGADHWVGIFKDKGGAAAMGKEKEKNRFVFSALYIHSVLARATEIDMLKLKLSETKEKLLDTVLSETGNDE
jgi:DNA-binding MltR family transcriptional regulator